MRRRAACIVAVLVLPSFQPARQATDLGLGTCWVCWFDALRAAQLLDLPAGVDPIALLPIGYAAETKDPARHGTDCKPLGEIVSWDGYPRTTE